MKNSFFSLLITGVLISTPLAPYHVVCPESLHEWFIEEGFTYQAEGWLQDYWKTPEETVKDKGGDCEDFAFLVDKVLSDLNYETHTIAMFFKKSAHAICFVKINGKYTWFDNYYYCNRQHDTIEEILNIYYPGWIYYYTINLPKSFNNKVTR